MNITKITEGTEQNDSYHNNETLAGTPNFELSTGPASTIIKYGHSVSVFITV
jgi:hypothetical protein